MITLRQITDAASAHAGVSVHAMRSRCSVHKVSRARGLAAATARRLTEHTWQEIADWFGVSRTGLTHAAGNCMARDVRTLCSAVQINAQGTVGALRPGAFAGYTHSHGAIT